MFVGIYKTVLPQRFELSLIHECIVRLHNENTYRVDRLVRIIDAPTEELNVAIKQALRDLRK